MARLLAIAAFVIVVGTALNAATASNGLFNNIADRHAAMNAHQAAWKQIAPRPLTKASAINAMRMHGAECRPFIDNLEGKGSVVKALSCEKSVSRRFAFYFGSSFYWVVILHQNSDGYSVVKTKREEVSF